MESHAMHVVSRTAWAIERIRTEGARAVYRDLFERYSERYYEWRLGIRTTGKVYLSELGINSPLSFHYYPSDYRTIHKAFRRLSIRPEKDVFLDFGSGKGRVVTVAATFPFQRVIGVELSSVLATIARENIRRAARVLKCRNVEIFQTDALSYVVPDDVTVVFFYRPFRDQMLENVIRNLQQSIERKPRELTVVFKNPPDFSECGADSWLAKYSEFTACDAPHQVVILRHSPERQAP